MSFNTIFKLSNAYSCLAKFEIANAVITIEQSGKELIDLRGEEFKKIFPSFLANDGNKKLITILTSKNEDYFEYYIENKTNHTIEKFKMKNRIKPFYKISFIMSATLSGISENLALLKFRFNAAFYPKVFSLLFP